MPNYVPLWAQLGAADLKAMHSIADSIHPELPERPEVFAEKMRLYNPGCWKLCRNTEVVGYGVSHPWLLHSIPPLDDFLVKLPPNPDCLYIHDVAILPSARGQSSASKYIDIVNRVARDRLLTHLACVSVYGTDALWARYGFKVVLNDVLTPALLRYGSTAKYMIAAL